LAVVLAAGLALLAWGGLASTWVVIADTLCLGVVSAFSAPAQQALIVSLVRRDEVPTAVALNSMTFNLARTLGPAGAALCVHYLGIPASFAVNAASYGVFIAALVIVRPRRQEKASREESRVRDSFRLLRRRPELAAFLLIVAIVSFASDPVNTLSPAFANAYGRPDTWAGFIVGAFGAGAVTAALVVAGRVAGSRWRMAATLFLLGAGVAAFSVCPWLPLGFALLFVGGFGYLASNTAATTRLQLGADPRGADREEHREALRHLDEDRVVQRRRHVEGAQEEEDRDEPEAPVRRLPEGDVAQVVRLVREDAETQRDVLPEPGELL